MKTSSFIWLLVARFVSLVGSEIFFLGFPLYIYHQTNSTQQFGISIFIEVSLCLVFSLIGGVIADQWNLKKTVLRMDIFLFVIVLLFGLLLKVQFSLITSYTLIVVLSSVSAVYNVSFDKLPIQFIEGPMLSRILSYFQTLAELSVIVGAPLGGLIFYYWGVRGIIMANAISFLVPALVVFHMEMNHTKEPNHTKSFGRFFKDSFGGFRILKENEFLKTVTLLAVFGNIPFFIHKATWPILYKVGFGMSDKVIGFVPSICAIFFVGSTLYIGKILSKNFNSSLIFLLISQVCAITGAFIIFEAKYWPVAIVGSIVLCLYAAFHNLPSTLIRTHVTKKEDYGKVLAAVRVISRSSSPISVTVATLLIPYYSIQKIFLFAAMICLILTIIPVGRIFRMGTAKWKFATSS